VTRPVVPAVSELLYDELGVTQPGDDTRDWPFLIFLGAVGHALGELHDLVRDTPDGSGWSALLDPDRCPAWALPWLAQFAGVRLTPGLTDSEWRAQITSPPAFRRGTPLGLRDEVQRELTATKAFTLTERYTSPYTLLAVSYTAETPDPAAAQAAAERQKAAGLILTYRVDPGWSVGQMETAYAGQTLADLEGDYATLDALEHHLP
jgi:hypothetical protein